ncbi:hypothetical protein PGT21_030445 [Puccinia graminis f. sp. tritici]|uniref:Uncharacterized protein n=1 Tax=Puccinia graminis f. sp. tritici TaxID=56615 RepID=A0A5B0NRG8_PUCGR|nr:hypothetical protein PGTUg99_026175 [Puccinia graminis f. sp. tritici]KAA1091242.1 hypothetical protein PGT21_029380 [Puccinia graminis f. sp. tritici]KAA1110732.1 hypothetical protein PGT21_030445 [Puccinia graminis f. sp. tritici]
MDCLDYLEHETLRRRCDERKTRNSDKKDGAMSTNPFKPVHGSLNHLSGRGSQEEGKGGQNIIHGS